MNHLEAVKKQIAENSRLPFSRDLEKRNDRLVAIQVDLEKSLSEVKSNPPANQQPSQFSRPSSHARIKVEASAASSSHAQIKVEASATQSPVPFQIKSEHPIQATGTGSAQIQLQRGQQQLQQDRPLQRLLLHPRLQQQLGGTSSGQHSTANALLLGSPPIHWSSAQPSVGVLPAPPAAHQPTQLPSGAAKVSLVRKGWIFF